MSDPVHGIFINFLVHVVFHAIGIYVQVITGLIRTDVYRCIATKWAGHCNLLHGRFKQFQRENIFFFHR